MECRQFVGLSIEITKIVRKWREYFQECKVPREIVEGVERNLKLNLIDIEEKEKRKRTKTNKSKSK